MAFRELTSSQSTPSCDAGVTFLVSALDKQASRSSRVRVRICDERFAIVTAVKSKGWVVIKYEGKKRDGGNGASSRLSFFSSQELVPVHETLDFGTRLSQGKRREDCVLVGRGQHSILLGRTVRSCDPTTQAKRPDWLAGKRFL
jgi:hypothetical protein